MPEDYLLEGQLDDFSLFFSELEVIKVNGGQQSLDPEAGLVVDGFVFG